MKKWFVFGALLLIALAVFFWWQNTNDPNVLYEDTLSNQFKGEISAAFLDKYGSEFYWGVKPDIGTINGCTVLAVRDGFETDIERHSITIADFEFRVSALFAYRSGEVCRLQEAYENGWLTKEHIGLIHAKYQEIEKNWDIYYQEWLEQKEAEKNSPEASVIYRKELTEEEKQNIRTLVLEKYNEIVRWGYVDPYYGTINNYSVVVVHPRKMSDEGAWIQQIAGCTFEWDSPIGIYVYYHAKYNLSFVYTLQAAYENGLLTEKQIGEIYKRHLEYRDDFPYMLEEWEKSQKESE